LPSSAGSSRQPPVLAFISRVFAPAPGSAPKTKLEPDRQQKSYRVQNREPEATPLRLFALSLRPRQRQSHGGFWLRLRAKQKT